MVRTGILSFAVLALAAAAPARAADDPFKMASVEEVAKLVGQPGVRVFDANPRDVYEKGHLPGAVFVEKPAAVASLLPQDKDAKLIFYCKNPK